MSENSEETRRITWEEVPKNREAFRRAELCPMEAVELRKEPKLDGLGERSVYAIWCARCKLYTVTHRGANGRIGVRCRLCTRRAKLPGKPSVAAYQAASLAAYAIPFSMFAAIIIAMFIQRC